MNSAFVHCSQTKSQQVRLKKKKKTETQKKLNVDAKAKYKHTLSILISYYLLALKQYIEYARIMMGVLTTY